MLEKHLKRGLLWKLNETAETELYSFCLLFQSLYVSVALHSLSIFSGLLFSAELLEPEGGEFALLGNCFNQILEAIPT